MKYIADGFKIIGMLVIALIVLILPLGIAEATLETVSTPFAVVLMFIGLVLMAGFASWTVDKGW